MDKSSNLKALEQYVKEGCNSFFECDPAVIVPVGECFCAFEEALGDSTIKVIPLI